MAHTPGQILPGEKRRCSCQISAVGPLDRDTYIQYCPLHTAAPALLAALEAMDILLRQPKSVRLVQMPVAQDMIREAIAQSKAPTKED